MHASLGLKPKSSGGEILISGDVAMRERDTFGLAGGAGGVDQCGQILGLDGVGESVEDGIVLGASRVSIAQQFAQTDRAFGHRRIHHDERFQLRLRAECVQLVELLARGNDGDAAAGVAHQFRHLLTGEGGIDGHIGRTDGQGGKIGDCPLPAILADEGDAVALLCAQAQKRCGQGPHSLIDLIGRERMPGAELVLPENGARIGRR